MPATVLQGEDLTGLLYVLDANRNEVLKFAGLASAINELTVTNAAIGGHPVISASGGDTNINIVLTPKGSGILSVGAAGSFSGVLTSGVHTINPATATPPIILSANGQSQLVTGLNADLLDGFHAADLMTAGNPLKFASTASVSHTGTAETSLIGSGVGSKVLLAGFWTAGKTVVIEAWGTISTDAAPGTLSLVFRLDAVSVVATGAFTPAQLAALVDRVWRIRIVLTCRTTGASGTVFAQGSMRITSYEDDQNELQMGSVVATTIDTTQADTIDLTADWSSASANNVIVCTNFLVWSY